MQIDIITLFPNVFFGPFAESIIARAVNERLIRINTVNPRDFTEDKHRTVDDTPYGGGPGMLMMADPLCRAIESCRENDSLVILTSPGGEVFSQTMAKEFSLTKHLIIVCGHYEGVDERVRELLIDREVSIGDYVLTNGNIPAMVIVDCVARLLPGVLGDDSSSVEESFGNGLLEYPQYTRPLEYRGVKVPDVLLSGNHKKIRDWRREQSILKTKEYRKDLYENFLDNNK
ncbi:MAG TPA: tRNA (guanosine(37)-N1)-methyltransferase TrmD [Lentisphaeria bacterium]|nr:MAG: tRNA (guanosine(37)-N1)-methyltransferase TrmD [Lentisphaerae bacterium GWF2_38_69]HBM14996.1 tRNA (guanosine(37)-N1)-methyltransferase TrmD [Lentisphaeria bacterium]